MSTQKCKKILVNEVMLSLDRVPIIRETVILKEALDKMGQSQLGIVCIINDSNKLIGIITDGDIRRKLLKVQKPFSAFFIDDALNHAILSPLTIEPKQSLLNAIDVMGEKQVWDLPVVDSNQKLLGLLHLHPAIKALLNQTKNEL